MRRQSWDHLQRIHAHTPVNDALAMSWAQQHYEMNCGDAHLRACGREGIVGDVQGTRRRECATCLDDSTGENICEVHIHRQCDQTMRPDNAHKRPA
jgi:hypothetical protein